MAGSRSPVDLSVSLPPQDLAAERSLLGSLLLDNQMFDEVCEIVRAECFYSDINGAIFGAIAEMVNSSKPADPVTLADALAAAGKLDDIGGIPTILDLLETVPHAAHARHYAVIVREKWLQRSLVSVCTDVLRDCYGQGADPGEVLEKAERGVFGILENRESGAQLSMSDILVSALGRIDVRISGAGESSISGLSSGFVELDRQTNGFQPSELVILAARPSMGKTAFVCNIAEWCADAGKTTTLIFSLEQSKLELAERFLCIRARLDGHKLRKGLVDAPERHALLTAANELGHLPLFIDDTAGRTVGQISAICRRLKRRNKLGLVIIDYLQLIEPEDKRANREQQIAQTTRRLKGIAKENDVPVIALSQLNRGVELREDKRPRLADLRESGAIEQDADIVMFLHRPEAYNPEDRPGEAEVIVAKHRSGPTGIVSLAWRKESMRFEDLRAATDGF